MKSFIKRFFESSGSSIARKNGQYAITLATDLEQLFGQKELKLVFEADDVNEDTELVTHGSYVLNTIHAFLQDRGIKIVSKLPEKFKTSKDQIEEKIEVENGSIRSSRVKKEKTVDIIFNFKVTFLSDEKSEDIYSMGIDQRGTVFDSKSYYTDELIQNELIPQQQKGAIELTRKEAEQLFRQCLKAASQRAQEFGRSLQNDILKRLHRNITRIKGYYTAQIEELHRNQPSYEERRLMLEREYEHKLKEEIKNHQLRIVLKLLSYHVIERTETQIHLDLKPKRNDHAVTLQILYDNFSDQIDYGACPTCQAVMDKIIFTHDGMIGCSRCVLKCESCGSLFSDKVGTMTCEICDKHVCQQCLISCSQCGNKVCKEHVHACDVGNEMTCEHCLKKCSTCGKNLCDEHTFRCAATSEPICFEHRVICRGCRKIYSSNYVSRIKKKEKVCPSCATEFE